MSGEGTSSRSKSAKSGKDLESNTMASDGRRKQSRGRVRGSPEDTNSSRSRSRTGSRESRKSHRESRSARNFRSDRPRSRSSSIDRQRKRLRRWTDELIEREKAVRKLQRESEERVGALQRAGAQQRQTDHEQRESQKETERKESQAKRGRKRPNPMRRVGNNCGGRVQ